MRIINIINNELIIRKQKLENELEKVLNSTTQTTEEQVKSVVELINKLIKIKSNY